VEPLERRAVELQAQNRAGSKAETITSILTSAQFNWREAIRAGAPRW